MNNSTISSIALKPIELKPTPNSQWIPLSEIPTLGEPRYYHRSFWNFWHPIVVPLAGQNWEIVYHASYTRQGLPTPQVSTVSFTPTQAPETPYTPTKRSPRTPSGYCVGQAKNRARLTGDSFSYGRLYPIRFFKCLPIQDDGVHVPKDVRLYQLAIFWTGWGEGGNENLFVNLDEKGVPSAVYIELAQSSRRTQVPSEL